MKENRFYKINKDSKVHFNNKVDFCVGTGRMGLALQKEIGRASCRERV